MDPPPFTISTADPNIPQPTVSLTEYPLPDGTWRWVSREWMIDMRGEGAVQFDGFEYSWSFHSKKWRSNIGFLSTGGLVRRRRWIRLMMRPRRPLSHDAPGALSASNQIFEMLDIQYERTVTRPPSVASPRLDSELEDVDDVWRADEDNWTRCQAILKRLGDGVKLELWKAWLEDNREYRWKGKEVQRTADSRLLSVESSRQNSNEDIQPFAKAAPKELVRAVIQAHVCLRFMFSSVQSLTDQYNVLRVLKFLHCLYTLNLGQTS